ncbi:LysE family translocator [Thalassotalea atypica]|uniref:LysE family translocator n=1 Tax=Thalassotalea atypica TaxID=2054316 RepID=UPI00257245C8|nr:LysE family transporter [Thalassotalea atypica]
MSYLDEFLVIAVVHFLAVASPGPDFAIILKQSVRYGRKTALMTSLGIGTGILVHVAYSLVGIGLLIASDERLFTLLKYIAASYFCYIAWHGLRAKKPTINEQGMARSNDPVPSNKRAFSTGFLVNGLNVKATLFFVSLFSMVISPDTPTEIKLSYGIYMAVATAAWFSLLSYLLNHQKMGMLIQTKGYWLDRIMGAILLLLAIELVLSDISQAGIA